MAEDAARVALPRLRAAWLREMGVEVLWPASARPLRSAARQDVLEDGDAPDTGASSGAAAASVESLQPQPQPQPQSQPVLGSGLGQCVPVSLDEGADQAAGRVEASLHEDVPMLECRLYAGDASSGGVRWMVVSDAAELHASREGPVRFLDALIHAIMPGGEVSAVSIPVRDEEAIGWLAGDEIFARLAAGRLRLILIGTAARRAAGMPTRLGEIGRLQAGPVQLPAVALPLLNDLTASPTGKIDTWRVLHALDAAGP